MYSSRSMKFQVYPPKPPYPKSSLNWGEAVGDTAEKMAHASETSFDSRVFSQVVVL